MDDTEINKSFAELNRTMKVVQSEFQAAGAKLGDFGKSTESLKAKAESLTKQIDVQQQIVAKLRAEHARAASEKGEDAKQTQNLEIKLNKAQAELSKMQHALKEATADITKQSSAWTKLSDTLNAVGQKMQAVGQKISEAGRSLSMTVTTPLVAIGGLASKASIDFESAFAGVRKTVDATEAEFASFKHEIIEMSKSIPAAATEIAGVAEAAGQLGIEKESLMGFTRTMIDLGVATNMSSEEAAMSLARFATITQMSQKDFDRLGSTIVGLGNNFAATESEITAMGLRLAGQGNLVRMTEHQILALATAMSAVGIEAEAGGTAMSMVMKKIDAAVGKSGAEMAAFAKAAGMSAEQFKKLWQDDSAAAISAFVEGLSRAGASGQNLALILAELGITGIREQDTMLRLAGAGDVLANALNTAGQAWTENSALAKEAEQRYGTTASQLEILKNNAIAIGITLGDALLPALLSVVNAMKPLLDMVADAAKWFTGLNETVQRVVIAIGAIAAAIGPALIVIGSLVSSVGTIVSAFGGVSLAIAEAGGVMAMLSGPVGIAVAVLGALVAAGIAVYQNWDKIKAKADEVFVKISPALEKVQRIFEAVWPHVQKIVQIAWETMAKITSSTIDIILGIIDVFVGAFTGDWKQMWSGCETILSGAWGVFNSIISGGIRIVLELIAGLVSGLMTYFQQIGQNMITYGNNMVQGLGQGIMSMAGWIKEQVLIFVTGIADTIKGFFGINSPSTLMAQYGTFLVEGLWQGIQNMIGWITERVTSFSEGVANTIREFFGIASPAKLMIQFGGFIAEGLAKGIETLAPKAVAAAKAMASAVVSSIQSTMSILNGTIFENIGGNWVEGGKVGGRVGGGDPIYGPGGAWEGMPDWLKPSTPAGGGGSETDSGRRRPADTDKEGAYQKDVNKDNFGGGANTNVRSAVKSAGEKIKDALDKVADKLRIPGLVGGGTVTAAGWTLVGEKGPELLNLPRGSQVIPNYELPRLGGAGIDYQALAQALARVMKPSVTQYNTFTSPQALTPSETARKNQQVMRQMGLEWGLR